MDFRAPQAEGLKTSGGAKKSLYLFLCSILGMLLFLLIHRLLFFFYLLLVSANPGIFSGGLNTLEISALDFFSLILALFAGMWYGIWIGLRWFELVYEKNSYGGFVDHMVATYWPQERGKFALQEKVHSVAAELVQDALELETISKAIKIRSTQARPIKRKIVRKRAAVKKKAGI